MSSLAGKCCSAVGCASTAAYSNSEMRLDTPAVANTPPSRSNSIEDRMAADWRALARGSCAITCAVRFAGRLADGVRGLACAACLGWPRRAGGGTAASCG